MLSLFFSLPSLNSFPSITENHINRSYKDITQISNLEYLESEKTVGFLDIAGGCAGRDAEDGVVALAAVDGGGCHDRGPPTAARAKQEATIAATAAVDGGRAHRKVCLHNCPLRVVVLVHAFMYEIFHSFFLCQPSPPHRGSEDEKVSSDAGHPHFLECFWLSFSEKLRARHFRAHLIHFYFEFELL